MSLFNKNRKRLRKHQEEIRNRFLSSSESMKKELEKIKGMSEEDLNKYINGDFTQVP